MHLAGGRNEGPEQLDVREPSRLDLRGGNEPPPDAWPVDFNDDGLVTGSDVLKFGSVFGSSRAGGPPFDVRFDFNDDGLITGSDILKFGCYFGETCT